MNQMYSKHARTFAHTALEEAIVSLSVATQALENTDNAQPWSQERLNHAHAQDLLKRAQRQLDNLSSK